MLPRALFVAATLVAVTTRSLGAQADSSHATPRWRAPVSPCVAAIPDSALKPTLVYLTITSREGTPIPAWGAIDMIVQSAAERMRANVGGAPDSVKPAEPRLTWRDLDGSVTVVWRRDGSADWRVEHGPSAAPADTGTTAGIALLLHSLDELRPGPGNYLPLPWPDLVNRDSVTFTICFVYHQMFDPEQPDTIKTRPLAPVFSMRFPRTTKVRGRRQPTPTYPVSSLQARANAYLIMEFVVDSTGRADMATVHDVWPSDKPRLTGTLGAYYESFRSEVTRSLRSARFEPARLNGCPVRQLVQQPFDFKVAK